MGACCSGEENAPETDVPPPKWGEAIKVHLRKQGMFDADYDITHENADGEKWMLLDAVGGFFDDGFTYYLKHRHVGAEDSTVLGAVNIKGDWDAFSFKVVGADRDADVGVFYDVWDRDFDLGVTTEKELWAVWTYSKRAVIYKDYEMTEQIGWLDISGSGTWWEEEEEVIIHDTDPDGNETIRYERERRTSCKTQAFQYKFNVFNTPMASGRLERPSLPPTARERKPNLTSAPVRVSRAPAPSALWKLSPEPRARTAHNLLEDGQRLLLVFAQAQLHCVQRVGHGHPAVPRDQRRREKLLD